MTDGQPPTPRADDGDALAGAGRTTPENRPLALVADDDADIVALVAITLERVGCEVVRAFDGEEALSLAQERTPDVAVLDVMMPRLDGHALTRALRARPETRTTPIVILTAAVQDSTASESDAAGADVHMRKPFSPADLARCVERLLGR